VDRLEVERFAMQFRRVLVALKFPRKHCGVLFIVPERLAIGCLMFFAKMRAGRFISLESVPAHELGELQEIGNTSGAFQGLVEIFVAAKHAHIAPEFFSQFGNFLKRFAQSLFVARHSAFFPQEEAEFAMEGVE
jgi:hypothetical protein